MCFLFIRIFLLVDCWVWRKVGFFCSFSLSPFYILCFFFFETAHSVLWVLSRPISLPDHDENVHAVFNVSEFVVLKQLFDSRYFEKKNTMVELYFVCCYLGYLHLIKWTVKIFTFFNMIPCRALWVSWAQRISVSAISLIIRKNLHSGFLQKVTSLSSKGQIQAIVN